MKLKFSIPLGSAERGAGFAAGTLMALAYDIGMEAPFSFTWWIMAAAMIASAGTIELNLKRYRLEGEIMELELEQVARIEEYHAALDDWWAEKERRERDG